MFADHVKARVRTWAPLHVLWRTGIRANTQHYRRGWVLSSHTQFRLQEAVRAH